MSTTPAAPTVVIDARSERPPASAPLTMQPGTPTVRVHTAPSPVAFGTPLLSAAGTPMAAAAAKVPNMNRLRSSSVDRAHAHPPSRRRIRVGVCARDKKALSKPMRAVLTRFDTSVFDVIIFGDEVLDKHAIEKWPVVDCLMSWYSSGFPLEKAEAYVKLRRPFCVNDLSFEHVLRDRRRFYAVLEAHGIPTPQHVILDRDGPVQPVVVETEDSIEVNGVRINKPFVEKPVDAEDHNIYIYYPRRLGGGSKRLFRKVGNSSSKFYPELNNIRTEGSYIYEEFVMTQGTDIKIYVVGPDYAHAEARKSPVVDGIVQRDEEGKEVRFPILLTNKEKDIARRVCLAFRQNVCGFDLLRTPGRSYVCDVNGWSFVKKSHKYYDDCSHMLQLMMLRAVAPERLTASILLHTSPPAGLTPGARFAWDTAFRLSGRHLGSGAISHGAASKLLSPTRIPTIDSASELRAGRDDGEFSVAFDEDASMDRQPSLAGNMNAVAGPQLEEELRCVVAVIRHGDRTPKQKLKMRVSHPDFLAIHARNSKGPREEAKLKSAAQLQALLEVTRAIIAARGSGSAVTHAASPSDHDADHDHEEMDKLVQMKLVLEKGGHFSGINRKVQLKPTRWRTVHRKRSSAEQAPIENQPSPVPSLVTLTAVGSSAPREIVDIALMGVPVESLPAIASAAAPAAATQPEVPAEDMGQDVEESEVVECLLVLKWGGVLTHAGRQQAEALGQRFREVMYPGESGGLLRLHSTYRHDLKIYSSDEGRVQMTAAAFVKGFLDLEGELTPILASLVKTVNTSNLLDDSDPARDVMTSLKKRLKKALTTSIEAGVTALGASSSTTSDESDVGHGRPRAADALLPDGSASQSSGRSRDQPQQAAGDGATLPPNVVIPGKDELLALEREISDKLVGTIAPTRAAALLLALRVIGADPRKTLHRVYFLIKSMVEQLQQRLQEQRLRAETRRNSAALATGLIDEARAAATTETSARWRARLGTNDDVKDDELPSEGSSSARGDSSAKSVAEDTAATDDDGPCCAGETLWLMCERWRKLMNDLYSEKRDRFDLSKIPDVYDQVKYDCLHNATLGLVGLEELYTLSKAFADLVVCQEYGISVEEKRDIAARIGHHLLRKLFFDLTAVAVEDTLEQDTPMPSPPAKRAVVSAVAAPADVAASTRSSARHARSSTASHTSSAAADATARVAASISSSGTAASPAMFVDGERRMQDGPMAHVAGASVVRPEPHLAAGTTVVLPVATETAGADVCAGTSVAHTDSAAAASASTAFVSSVPGLIVTLRQHEFSARLRRKSAPGFLTTGLNSHRDVKYSDVPHFNPAVGPYLGPNDVVESLGVRTFQQFAPLHTAGTLVDWHGAQHRLIDFSLVRGNTRPVVDFGAQSGGPKPSLSATLSADIASVGSGTALRRRPPRPGGGPTSTAGEDDALETASVHTSASTGPSSVSYERAVSGTVLVPGIRFRHRTGAPPPGVAAVPEDNAELMHAQDSASASTPNAGSSTSPPEPPPASSPSGMGVQLQPFDASIASGASHAARRSSDAASAVSQATAVRPSPGSLYTATAAGTASPSTGRAQTPVTGEPAVSGGEPSPPTAATAKMNNIIATIAHDMQDISETVHQLDARLIEMQDTGYGEIKTPTRHVRTRLYFTSESHVQALVNALKYWVIEAPDVEASPNGSVHESQSDAARARSIISLLSPDGFAMLDATPELDYMTHIVFRLYENFSVPPGHPKRHRIEVLFSPGAACSPFDGSPVPPRTVPPAWLTHRQRVTSSTSNSSSIHNSPFAGDPRVSPRTHGMLADGVPLTALSLPAAAPALIASNSSPTSVLSRRAVFAAAPTKSADGEDTPSVVRTGALRLPAGEPRAAHESERPGAIFFMGDADADTPATDPDGTGDSAILRGSSMRQRSMSRFSGPDARASVSSYSKGPLCASAADRASHTLPVVGLVPLHNALALQDFEDVFAEAIYYGVMLHLSETVAKEQHPKDEMKARAAAAALRAQRNAADGYFRY